MGGGGGGHVLLDLISLLVLTSQWFTLKILPENYKFNPNILIKSVLAPLDKTPFKIINLKKRTYHTLHVPYFENNVARDMVSMKNIYSPVTHSGLFFEWKC